MNLIISTQSNKTNIYSSVTILNHETLEIF